MRRCGAALLLLAVACMASLLYVKRQPRRCSCAEYEPCSPHKSEGRRRCAKERHALIVHEQHPQALGCDRRLLALVALMQGEGWRVSFLYRRHVPEAQQEPRTRDFARLLNVVGFEPALHLDGGCLGPPPALYRFDGRGRQVAQLARQGWFDLVLLSVWFWNEPASAFAEIVLPLLRQYNSPSHQQPYVGLLIDDAHAIRAKRLASWETDPSVRALYEQQATSLTPRLRALYGHSDAVLHVSSADQQAERAEFGDVGARGPGHARHALRWQLLRTPLHAMRSRSTALRRRSMPPPGLRLGFLGNGQTATNHQGVQWFLTHCWPLLRAKFPTLRLRLVGRTPGLSYNATGVFE